MSEILGLDCNGQPLRAGDRVVATNDLSASPRAKPHLGGVHVIAGRSRLRFWKVCLETTADDGKPIHASPEALRKIPDLGSWDDLEKTTNWNPSKVAA